MLTEFLVGNDALQISIFTLIGVPLSRQQECQLLQGYWVLALGHKLANQLNVVHLLSDSHSLWVPLELSVDIESSPEGMLHFFSVCCVVGAGEEIVADSLEVVRVGEVIERTEAFNFKKQIDSFRLLIMIDELRNDLVYQLVDFFHRLVSLNASLVVLTNLASEATEILVSPADKVLARSQKAELESLCVIFLL